MNVLVVMGVYSGLADSLASGRWQPRGVPAVYRLLEGLARRKDVTASYVFLARSPDARFGRPVRKTVAPLGDRVWILPWRPWPLLDRLRLGNVLREAEQALRVLVIAWRTRAQVAYCANAAYVAASLLARFRIAPVVLRFLGIFPVHKQMAECRGHAIACSLYRAPFARAVCTLEGSGAEYYLPKLLRRDVPCEILLNGADRHSPDANAVATLRQRLSPQGNPIIGFVGRLESIKGSDDFVEALVHLKGLQPGRFTGLIVGDGPLKRRLADRIAEAGLESCVTMTGSLPHREVAQHLAAIDVYVSLNRYGNLSNANLEGMVAGRCMLVLEADSAAHIDEVTERFVPHTVVERIPREGTAAALAAVLARLIDEPAEIHRRAQATAALAASLVDSWDKRIAYEIDIILAAGKASRAAA